MTTDVLIRLIATDARLRVRLGARIALALLGGGCLRAGAARGPLRSAPGARAGADDAHRGKTFVPLAAAGAALWAVHLAARPAAPMRPAARTLGAVVALIACGFVVLGILGGAEGLRRGLGNPMMMMCFTSVLLISAPILVPLLGALRSGANLDPARSGALAGLVAGAAGAAIYSLACDQDDALFVIPTYSGAVVALALAGAFVGQFTLKL